MPLERCVFSKKVLKGADICPLVSPSVATRLIAAKISALKRGRLPFIEILQQRSLTAKEKIRLDHTVLRSYFFFFQLISSFQLIFTSVIPT